MKALPWGLRCQEQNVHKHLFLLALSSVMRAGSTHLLAIHLGKPIKADGKLRPSFRPSRTARVFR
jgi:hypothetical protein